MFKKKKSPGQELRERVQSRIEPLDREAILFQSEVFGIAIKEFYSDVHCDAWHDRLYQEYLSDGSPSDRKSWIRIRLGQELIWVDSPPDWGKEEPEWPFWEDKPMVFLHQFGLPENDITRDHATWDVMLYVFGIRIPRTEVHSEGYEMKYQVVARAVGLQTEDEHQQ